MSKHYIPQDYQARNQALKVDRSFIVQAPAGAGKTGLLTQRFLNLLAHVDHPESIIAITFTRKAAGEMRERIFSALKQATDNRQPEVAHEAQTWRLARAVLERDEQNHWGLMENPGRLRVQTFDSLSAWLAGQMPLLSEFGTRPNTVDDPSPLYAEAALNTINQIHQDNDITAAVATLLSHLDNQVPQLIALISGMLARRDQWLRHVADKDNSQLTREPIEAALAQIVSQALADLSQLFPPQHVAELTQLIRFAADNLGPEAKFYGCRDLEDLPGITADEIDQWMGIASFLLTLKGEWRSGRGITKKIGFPASDKMQKQRMVELIESLAQVPELRDQLSALEQLPAYRFKDEEWDVLNALFTVLRYAVLELKLAFQSQGQVDFAEISLKSLYALGRAEEPSELLLKLDYQIRHLLVDEFQDTSINQFQLLEKLTSGWELGDGRSMFLVGDPMQSIYRFREAEVGLFLRTKMMGIGTILPEFLQLSVNFRSQEGIIDWVNQSFPQVLPSRDDSFWGAVSYAESEAAKESLAHQAVQCYPQIERDDELEASQVIQIIQQSRRDDPQGSIAILVSGRSHLSQIVPYLEENQIAYNAVKIDALADKAVVNDLFALTQALLHPDDRIHWLAILRAPWCGLSLADLLVLAEAPGQTLLQSLLDSQRLQQLSAEGQKKVQRLTRVVQAAIGQRNRKNLRPWIEGTWIALGGPAVLYRGEPLSAVLNDAEAFFRLLERLDQGGELVDYYELEKQVAGLFAQSDTDDPCAVQIMTIHAAKGLEFDHVIIPGMGRAPAKDQSQLLYWAESNQSEQSQLLFAPINSTQQKNSRDSSNKTASYIKQMETKKRRLEMARLLYVGVTRAKKYLHLLGHAALNREEELIQPPAGSLLHSLWPVVEAQFEQAKLDWNPEQPLQQQEVLPVDLTRGYLSADWSCPEVVSSLSEVVNVDEALSNEDITEFSWASDMARHVGTVVHRILEFIAEDSKQRCSLAEYGWDDIDQTFAPIARQHLTALGLNGEDLESAQSRVLTAVVNTLNDERGQWILSHQHQQAACELALSLVEDETVHHIVIDRTFIDSDGTRWIIDYKTGTHQGSGLAAYLDEEVERYQEQLLRYAKAMRKMEDNPIKTALYFPLMGEFKIVSSDT